MKKYILLIVIFIFCLFGPVQAQNKMAMTITPPLIKNNVNPGQIWKSYIKVVNNNPEDIDVFVQLVNFESGNETGTVKLVPLNEDDIKDNEFLINNWINIEKGPIKVKAYKSKDIPFIVDVPKKADPGDHHIAILVGTEPNKDTRNGTSIKISSKIGSLLLLNVGGDVKESGIVREFSTDKKFYSSGDINFTLRFQNTGNTILQPQGEIRIYNYGEKDQGSVAINHKSSAGNVFPQDIRRWEYNWPVPSSILKMGRYRAEMILAYGNQSRETIERNIYFWVIQLKPVLTVLAILLLFVLIVVLMIRRYIKKAIIRTQEQIGIVNPKQKEAGNRLKVVDDMQAVVDLKVSTNKTVNDLKNKKNKKLNGGIFRSVVYIIVLALIVVVLIFVYFYFQENQTIIVPLEEVISTKTEEDVFNTEEVKKIKNDQKANIETLDKETILDVKANEKALEFEKQKAAEEVDVEKLGLNKDIKIKIQNGSGRIGSASRAEEILNNNNYKVEKTGNASNFDYDYTVIEYRGDNKKNAEFLAKKLNVSPEYKLKQNLAYDLLIILGSDFE